jgi:hypothetical protein
MREAETLVSRAAVDVRVSGLLAWFLLLAWAASAYWVFLDDAGASAILIWIATIGTASAVNWKAESLDVSLPPLTGTAVAMGAALCIPTALFLAFSWSHEFPFVGDHDFHLLTSATARSFWVRRALPAALILVPAYLGARRTRWAPFIASVAFIGWCFFDDPPDITFFTRYPGIGYLIDAPALAVAELVGHQTSLQALRLTGALAIPGWLLVLRPWLIRRWPDISILPFAALLLWQKDVVYYFASAYLEAWAVVLMACAAEHLIRYDVRASWRPHLMVAFAALIKEQSILFLPFVALATWPWHSPREWPRRAALAAVCAGPFLAYWAVRQSAKVWRTAGLASWSEVFTPARIHEFGFRVWTQWGPSVVVLMLAALLLLVPAYGRTQRRIAWILAAAGLGHVLFFFADAIALNWAGYPRFHLIPTVFFGAGLLVVAVAWETRHVGRLLGISAVVAGLNLVTLRSFLSTAAGGALGLNYFEHYDAPVHLPHRRTLRAARNQGLLDGVERIRLVDNLRYNTRVASAVYGPELRGFSIDARQLPVNGEVDACQCGDVGGAVLAGFVYFTQLGVALPHRPESEAQARRCVERLEETCARVLRVEEEGQLVGALGSGLRPGLRP